MKKISDLYEMRYRATWGNNANGEHTIVNEEYQAPREVKTINYMLRIVHLLVDWTLINIISWVLDYIPDENISSFLSIVGAFSYYVCFEYFLQTTPGKMLTKSIVIDDFGGKPDLRTVMLRTVLRVVPFEPFSCMDKYSRGWHDKWSNTYVITKEEYEKLLPELKEVSSAQ